MTDTSYLKLDVLPPVTRRAFLACTEIDFFSKNNWYLAGGTALALLVGHRASVDLDFFTPHQQIDAQKIERSLLATGKWTTARIDEGTIFGTLLKAKVSLIAYPFFMPSPETCIFGTVTVLLPKDIAVMKIIAISQRGKKRDFVDLYWYCTNREPLQDILSRVGKHYAGQEENIPHFLVALTYFKDAEEDPMPDLNFNANWRSIKKYFQKEVKKTARVLGYSA